MRLDKASLSVCIKSTTVSVTAALDLFKPLNWQCVFEGMSRQVTACLHLGLFCKCVWLYVCSVCKKCVSGPHGVSTTMVQHLLEKIFGIISCFSSYFVKR